MGLVQGIAHINLTIPPSTLPAAHAFYGTTLGLTSVPVPKLQQGTLAWFDITPGGQQIHISFGEKVDPKSRNHPCFNLGGKEELEAVSFAVLLRGEGECWEWDEGVLGRLEFRGCLNRGRGKR